MLGFGSSLALPYLSLFGVNAAQMTPLQLGLFLTLSAVSAIGISTLLARWADQPSQRKLVLLLTLGAGVVGYLLLAILRSYTGVLVTAALPLGVAAAAFPQYFTFARAVLADVPGDLPERAQPVLRSIFSLSWVVGPGLGAVLLNRYSFQGVFLCTALCYLLAMFPLLRISGSASGLPVVEAKPMAGAKVDWPTLIWPSLAFVIYGLSLNMGSNIFPLFVTQVLQRSEGEVGLLVGLCALLEIPAMLYLVVSKRLPTNERLIKAALLAFVLHFTLIALAQGPLLLVAAQIVRALVLAIMASLGMSYFQELLPGRFSTATTLFVNTGNVGAMLAGLIAGVCAEYFGYRSVFWLCVLLTLASWIVMQSLIKRRTVLQS